MPRVKGMFLRGSTWWLRYTPGRNQPQQRVSLETDIEEVAAAKALQIMQMAPLEGADNEWELEVEKYLAERVRLRTMSPNTVPSRRACLLRFARETGVNRLNELSVKVVERWVDLMKSRRREGMSDGPVTEYTLKVYFMCVSNFMKWLVEKHRIRENYTAKVKLGKILRPVRMEFQGAQTVEEVIAKATNDDLRVILYCGYHAGMRKREICEARPHWFRLGDGTRRGCVVIDETPTFTPKDRDRRVVPLTAEFEEFLRRYLGRLPADAEFVLRPEKKHAKTQRGERAMYRVDFRGPFKEHLRNCGAKARLHDMRRTFVSLKVMEDSSLIFKLAKWTGTQVETLQDSYAHLLADDSDIEVGVKKRA